MVGSVWNGLAYESRCVDDRGSLWVLLRRYEKLGVVSRVAQEVRAWREEAINPRRAVDESGGKQFCQSPYMVCNPRFHGGRDADPPMDSAEVVVRKMKCQGRPKILPSLPASVSGVGSMIAMAMSVIRQAPPAA